MMMRTITSANGLSILSHNSIQQRGMRFWLVTVVLLITLTALPTFAQDQTVDLSDASPVPLNDDKLTDIDSYVADAMARFGIPGVTVAIVQNGKVIHMSGFGVRE